MSRHDRNETRTEARSPSPAKHPGLVPAVTVVLGLIVGSLMGAAIAGAVGGLAAGLVLFMVYSGVATKPVAPTGGNDSASMDDSGWSETRRVLPAAFLGLPLAILFFFAPPCCSVLSQFNLCGCTLRHEVPSPDESRRAVTFTFGCGATTRDVTGITILSARDTLPEHDTPPHFYSFSDESLEPRLRWTSDRELVVSGAPTEGAEVARTEFAGVTIRYVP